MIFHPILVTFDPMTKNKKTTSAKIKKTSASSKSFKLSSLDWKVVAGILVITLLLFSNTFDNLFVNWDDDYNIANNKNTALLSWDNIVRIFSEHVIGNYNPLPILTFAIERSIVGLDPTLYHINNVILHLICVFFAYKVMRGLNLPVWPAAFATLLFAIHPMKSESVAWVTERKDVLFGAFYLSALFYYIQYVRTGYKQKYVYIALILFFFSLISKIQAVSLPLTMLLVDYYFNRPLKIKLVLEKWMFFLLSLIIGLVGIYFLRQQGSINDETTYNFIQRLFIGSYSLGIYLIKFIFPYEMSPLYPYPGVLPTQVYFGPLAVIAVLTFCWIAFRKNWRPYLFGMLFFVVNVMFVLQVLGAGQGYLADRFTYIPYIGLGFMVAYGANELISKRSNLRTAILGVGAAYLLLLSFMTFKQNDVWQDSDTLWTHVLKNYDKTPLPFRNRANYRRDQGMIDQALQDYNSALALKADGALYNSRAKLYFNLKKYPEAMADYNQAIALDPTKGEMFINRGAVFALTGRMQEALLDFNKGLELDPDHANGFKNRSLIYQELGQWENAIKDINTYLGFHPEDADLWYERGRLRNGLGNPTEALADLDRAIRLKGSTGLFHYEKMKSLILLNRIAEARQMLPIVHQFKVNIEPEVMAKLN